MKIFTEKPLVDFIENYTIYRVVLQDWCSKIKQHDCESPEDITKIFENVEQIDNNTFIFSLNTGKIKITIKTIIIGQFVYVRDFGF